MLSPVGGPWKPPDAGSVARLGASADTLKFLYASRLFIARPDKGQFWGGQTGRTVKPSYRLLSYMLKSFELKYRRRP